MQLQLLGKLWCATMVLVIAWILPSLNQPNAIHNLLAQKCHPTNSLPVKLTIAARLEFDCWLIFREVLLYFQCNVHVLFSAAAVTASATSNSIYEMHLSQSISLQWHPFPSSQIHRANPKVVLNTPGFESEKFFFFLCSQISCSDEQFEL